MKRAKVTRLEDGGTMGTHYVEPLGEESREEMKPLVIIPLLTIETAANLRENSVDFAGFVAKLNTAIKQAVIDARDYYFEWAWHKGMCPAAAGKPDECTCGLTAAISARRTL